MEGWGQMGVGFERGRQKNLVVESMIRIWEAGMAATLLMAGMGVAGMEGACLAGEEKVGCPEALFLVVVEILEISGAAGYEKQIFVSSTPNSMDLSLLTQEETQVYHQGRAGKEVVRGTRLAAAVHLGRKAKHQQAW